MRDRLIAVGLWLVLILLGVGAWKANTALGRRWGEVDYGGWYVLQDQDGDTCYMKAVDEGNAFLEADSAERMMETTGRLEEVIRDKYGALVDIRGLVGNATIRTVPWRLFESEGAAVQYLVDQGVSEDDILFHYR